MAELKTLNEPLPSFDEIMATPVGESYDKDTRLYMENAPLPSFDEIMAMDSMPYDDSNAQISEEIKEYEADFKTAVDSGMSLDQVQDFKAMKESNLFPPKERQTLASRVSGVFFNSTISAVVKNIAGPDGSTMRQVVGNRILQLEKERGIKFSDAMWDDQMDDWMKQVQLPPEQRDEDYIRDIPQMQAPEEFASYFDPRYVQEPGEGLDPDAASSKYIKFFETGVNAVTGIMGFVAQLAAFNRIMPVTGRGTIGSRAAKGRLVAYKAKQPMMQAIAWDTVSQVNGGKIGEGSSLFGSMALVGRFFPHLNPVPRKLVSGGGIGTIFGGTTYLAGGSTEEVIFNTGLPIMLGAMSIKASEWKAMNKPTKYQMLMAVQKTAPQLKNIPVEKMDAHVQKMLETRADLIASEVAGIRRLGRSPKQVKAGEFSAEQQLAEHNLKAKLDAQPNIKTQPTPEGKPGVAHTKKVAEVGKEAVHKRALKMERDAILKDLVGEEGFADKHTHIVRNQKLAIEKAQNVPEAQLEKMVTGELAIPDGVDPGHIHQVLEKRYTARGDVAKNQWLASQESVLMEASSRAGQVLVSNRGQTYSAVNRGRAIVEQRTDKSGIVPDKKLKKNVLKAEKRLEKAEQKAGDAGIDYEIQLLKTAHRKAKPVDIRAKTYGKKNKFVTREMADAAMKRLGDQAKLRTGIEPKLLKDFLEISAYHLEAVGRDLPTWSKAMADQFGEKIKPHLAELWKTANKEMGVKIEAGIIGKLTKGFNNDKSLTSMTNTIRKLQREMIGRGITTRVKLVDEMHRVLNEIDPSITRRQAMDAMSGSGKFRLMKKDRISKIQRDLNQQMQQIAKIQNMTEGKAPPATGFERQEPSAEGRKLTKVVNNMKKKGGFTSVNAERELKSAISSIETRNSNNIIDLKEQLASRKKTIKVKRPTPTNPKIEQQKVELKKLRAEFQEMFGKKKLSPEQKQLIARKKRMQKRMDTLGEEIKAGQKKVKVKKEQQTDAEVQKMEKEIARLEQVQKDMFGPNKLSMEKRHAMAEKSLDNTITELERQVKTGDVFPDSSKKQKLTSPEIEAKRSRIEALKQERELLRNSKNPDWRDPHELEALKTRLLNERARMDEMIANEQYLKPEPKGFKLDKKAKKLLVERDEASRALRVARELEKRDVHIAKDEMGKLMELSQEITRTHEALNTDPRNMTLATDYGRAVLRFEAYAESLAVDTRTSTKVYEVLATPRVLMTSVDLSFGGRQGWGMMTTKDYWKGFFKQFGWAFSEAKFESTQASIRGHHMYKDAVDAGLALTDLGQKQVLREEGIYQTPLDHIPVVKNLIHGSQHAYTGYANYLRFNRYVALMEAAKMKGMTSTGIEGKNLAKDVATVVNFLTGRGNIGLTTKNREGLKLKDNERSQLVSQFFFSARKLSADFSTIAPWTYAGVGKHGALHPYARHQAIRHVAGSIAMTSAILGLAEMSGFEVEARLPHKLFGHIKVGGTWYDITGGKAAMLSFIYRNAKGLKYDYAWDEFVPSTAFDKKRDAARFVQGKAAPMLAFAADVLWLHEDYMGNEVRTPAQIAQRTLGFGPMIIGDSVDIMKDPHWGDAFTRTLMALPMIAPLVFGVGAKPPLPERDD